MSSNVRWMSADDKRNEHLKSMREQCIIQTRLLSILITEMKETNTILREMKLLLPTSDKKELPYH